MSLCSLGAARAALDPKDASLTLIDCTIWEHLSVF